MSVSSIAAAATSVQQAQLHTEVSYAVARKGLDAAKQQGQAIVSMLEAAAQVQQQSQVGMGVHLDVRG